MAWWVRVLHVFPEDPDSISCFHMDLLPFPTSALGDLTPSSDPLRTLQTCRHISRQNIQTHKKD